MSELKTKTLSEFKAELVKELNAENAKLEARVKKLESGYSELRDLFHKHYHIKGEKPVN